MVDLHSHILPGIDDGAKTPEDTRKLLEKQNQDGVVGVALTPHFNYERHTIPEFLEKRAAAFTSLLEGTRDIQLPALKLGAEIFFSPKLLDEDPSPLCYEGTKYLLVEFPITYYPKWAPDVFYDLQLAGITPVIAHVERYPFVIQDPKILYDWVSNGALTHVNATSIVQHPKRRKAIFKLMQHDLIHFIATDAHSMHKRPPALAEAYGLCTAKLGQDICEEMIDQARSVFSGDPVEAAAPSMPRMLFGKL